MIARCLQQLSWLKILFALVLVFAPFSAHAAGPAIVTAQDETRSILLGEYVLQQMAAGETASFSAYVPENGSYMVSADEEDAATFDLIVYDGAGAAVYEGTLPEASELTLTAGTYILAVTANADAELAFFFIGFIGTMSDSPSDPGKLYPGSYYVESSVSEERYATLSIPDVGYPQQVLIYTEAGEEDTFTFSVEGDDVGYRYIYSNENDLLNFWTEGGDYTIVAEPWERRSEFSLAVFLGGEPQELLVDDSIETSFSEDATMLVYALNLDSIYDEIVVEVAGGDEENPLEVYVVDRIYNSEQYFYAVEDDGVQVVEMADLFPGTYYVVVERSSGDGELAFTLSASGEQGEPLPALTSGEAATGEIASGETDFYLLDVPAAGALVTIDLVAENAENDFDLAMGRTADDMPWSSAHTGGLERLYLVAPIAGAYIVQVEAASGEGSYTLTADATTPAPLLENDQWIAGTLNEDGFGLFSFAVERPGQLLSVILLGDGEADLDLAVNLFDQNGQPIHFLRSTSAGAAEIVSQAAPALGLAEVVVSAYGDEGDTFSLLLRLEDPSALRTSAESGEVPTPAGPAAGFGFGQQSSAPAAGEAIYEDDFSDETSGWITGVFEGDTAAYSEGGYLVTLAPDQFASYDAPLAEAYQDVIVAVDVTQRTGGEEGYGGVLCRVDENYNYYDFAVSAAGDYAIGKLMGDDYQLLVDWTIHEAIVPGLGATNTVQAACIGDTLTLYVNGEMVDQVQDADLVSGIAAIQAGSASGGDEESEILFDNFVVMQP